VEFGEIWLADMSMGLNSKRRVRVRVRSTRSSMGSEVPGGGSFKCIKGGFFWEIVGR